MTVVELIAELQKWSGAATIVLDDKDSGWDMPVIFVGYGEHGRQRNLKTGEWDSKVHIWGAYDHGP